MLEKESITLFAKFLLVIPFFVGPLFLLF
jgi:hypothetical protein